MIHGKKILLLTRRSPRRKVDSVGIVDQKSTSCIFHLNKLLLGLASKWQIGNEQTLLRHHDDIFSEVALTSITILPNQEDGPTKPEII